MRNELKEIASKYDLKFYAIWGIEGGRGWIWYKQDDEKKFKVQIYVSGDFDQFNNIKSEVVKLFQNNNFVLSNEQDLEKNYGYRRNLYFMDMYEFESQKIEKERMEQIHKTPTYNIGQIKADGGIVTLGDVINSTQSIDNSIEYIESMIEKKGGNDKEELYATLNEAKEIINEVSETKKIKSNKKFMDKLNNHLSKHGWFYGAIVSLLGTAFVNFLS